MRRLADVEPGERARALRPSTARTRATCRSCSTRRAELLRAERGVLICVTRHGFVCANAGVDASNAAAPDDADPAARRSRRLGARAARAPARADRRRAGGRDHRLVRARVAPRPDRRRDRRRRDRAARGLARARRQRRPRAARDLDRARRPDRRRRRSRARQGLARAGRRRLRPRPPRPPAGDDGPGAAALLRPAAEDLFR